MVFETLAVAATSLFTGAAAYITFVEHPARLESGAAVALKQFRPSYRRGSVMQASLAVLGLAAGIAAWLTGRGIHFLIAALILGSVVAVTLLVIFPVNRQLFDESLDPDSPKASALLSRWGSLHAVRTLLGAVALAILLAGLARG
jgi:uncharacterized membrane protein